jgi:hypothetical protein
MNIELTGKVLESLLRSPILAGASVFAVLLAVATLVWATTRAFREGRELSFWPPRIGARPTGINAGSDSGTSCKGSSERSGSGTNDARSTVCSQESAYRELCASVADHKVKRAVLIQFTNVLASELTIELIRSGVQEIDVYVRDEQVEYSTISRRRMKTAREDLDIRIRNLLISQRTGLSCRLRWHRYKPPASLRAVLLEGRALVVGWYTYRQATEPERDAAYSLRGSETPGLLSMNCDSPEFNLLAGFIEQTATELREGARITEHWVTPHGLSQPIQDDSAQEGPT